MPLPPLPTDRELTDSDCREPYAYFLPPPATQHARVVALRQLTSSDISCILWAEDALNYAHGVQTTLFDQQILVPDELLESAAAVLKEGRYVSALLALSKGIRLKHIDVPEDEPKNCAARCLAISSSLRPPVLTLPSDVRSDRALPSPWVPYDDRARNDWWMRMWFAERRWASLDDLAEYRRQNPADVHKSSSIRPLYPRTSSTLPRINTTPPTLPRARNFHPPPSFMGLEADRFWPLRDDSRVVLFCEHYFPHVCTV
ncbi:hypothetical protein B0H17DRAFT_1205524 [Mycena rosella]|uniref:Uncharacterized protein n=1 Tax=Mycena rosella TaxID=1033263 RepID=A0AAD7G9Z5_MYCRO|nr:hypothetical protein B0H17DRAFT_1205524 [Mycena rosella]